MLINNQDGTEREGIEIVRDSPKNKSRVTVEYQFNVETDLLGTGGYGEVYKVKKKRGTLVQKDPYYALKIFNKINLYKESDKGSRILTEIKIHRSLNHEHICKYEHSFEDKRNVYILMEYCENGTLASYIRTRKYLEEYEIRYYMFQVLSVLKYLRREKIIHRDLTLGNIFLKDLKTVKIGDFGFAYKESENDEKSGVICGTPGYFTPESNNFKYSFKTDIFCFGVCIYYLFGGKPLFRTSNESAETFSNKELQFEKKLKFSVEALDLLTKTVAVENQRIDLDEIYKHPFFNKGKGLSKDKFPEYSESNKEQFFKEIKEIVAREGLKLTPFHHENKVNYSSNPNNNILSDGSNSNGVLSSNDSIHQNLLRNNSQSGKNVSFNVADNSPNNKSNRNGGNSLVYVSGHKSISKNKDKDKDKDKEKDNSKNSDIFRENLRKSLAQCKLESNIKTLNEKFKESNNSINSIIEENKPKINGKLDFNAVNSTLAEPIFDGDNEKESEIIKISKKNLIAESSNKKLILKHHKLIFIENLIDKLTDYCGIGYELNNKNIGVYFNDDTQIIKIFGKNKYIIYLYKDLKIIKQKKIPLPIINISSNNKKKISFLAHVVEEFSNNNKSKHKNKLKHNFFSNNNDDKNKYLDDIDEDYDEEDFIFIENYKSTNKAHFFVLSNKNIQVNFFDKTKIIFICYEPKKIIYFNKNSERLEFPIKKNFHDFKCDNVEIHNKIIYAIKEINK